MTTFQQLTEDECDDSLARLKDVVKLFLERSGFAERPVGFLLVAKDDVLEDRARDAELRGDFLVEVGALG